jgi:hypothetical protein
MVGQAAGCAPRAPVHRGGLRADILEDGDLQTGDQIAVCDG